MYMNACTSNLVWYLCTCRLIYGTLHLIIISNYRLNALANTHCVNIKIYFYFSYLFSPLPPPPLPPPPPASPLPPPSEFGVTL